MQAATIAFKDGVEYDQIHPAIAHAVLTTARLLGTKGEGTIVTSVTDGQHATESYHYDGRAVDIRTHHLTDDIKGWLVGELKSILGDAFHVILEHVGQAIEHLHVEYHDGNPPTTAIPQPEL